MTYPTVALRRLARIVNGGTPAPEDENWGGQIAWATPVDLGESVGGVIESTARTLTERGALVGSAVVPPDSILLSTRAPIGYVARSKVHIAFNQGCKALIPRDGMDSSFLYFAILNATEELQSLGQGSTFSELSGGSLASVEIPVPLVEAQRQIADYLDVQTAKIDALIEKQEQLIELLAERRQAVISHAVTKGLDPNAPMRDSGVPWLGSVPGAWTLTKVKRGYAVTLGKMLDAGRTVQIEDELLPYIRAANIQETGLDLEDVNTMPFSKREQTNFDLREADLLVVEGGAVGVNVVLHRDMPGWCFQKTVNRVRAFRGNSTKFLGYFLDMVRKNSVIDILSNRSTIAHFTAEKLNALDIAIPSIEVQLAIVAYLDRETAQIDALSAKAREMIEVLGERRQALISAAVTGKIDVRTASGVAS